MGKYESVYSDKRFQLARQLVIVRDMGLCKHCLNVGIYKKGVIVHHIIWLDDTNVSNTNIAFGIGNLVLWCENCHDKEHNRDSGLNDFTTPRG